MIIVRGIPIYWGFETEPEDRRFWTYSILHEVMPPFRHSTYGIRMRVSRTHWLHVGKFLYDKNARYYGLPVDTSEIATWGRKNVVPEETVEDEYYDESVRLVQPSGSGGSVGSLDDEEWGSVPWPESFGTGPGVDSQSA